MPIALITGANKQDGIGFEVARALGVQGYTVIIGSRRLEEGKAAVASLREKHGIQDAHSLQLDVSDLGSISAAVETIREEFDGKLDVLVHNAGTGISSAKQKLAQEAMQADPTGFQRGKALSTLEATGDDMKEVFTTNVFGAVDLTNALASILSRSTAPRVVMVSSARGSVAAAAASDPDRIGLLGYNSSKAALNMVTVMFSKALLALNPAFKVNAASPGHTKTSFNNYTGSRTVEEGAAVIVHLATLPEDGPTGGFFADHAPWKKGVFEMIPF